jgi:hypothetical protein
LGQIEYVSTRPFERSIVVSLLAALMELQEFIAEPFCNSAINLPEALFIRTCS